MIHTHTHMNACAHTLYSIGLIFPILLVFQFDDIEIANSGTVKHWPILIFCALCFCAIL